MCAERYIQSTLNTALLAHINFIHLNFMVCVCLGWRFRLMYRRSAVVWAESPARSAWGQSVTTQVPKPWLDPSSTPTCLWTGEETLWVWISLSHHTLHHRSKCSIQYPKKDCSFFKLCDATMWSVQYRDDSVQHRYDSVQYQYDSVQNRQFRPYPIGFSQLTLSSERNSSLL